MDPGPVRVTLEFGTRWHDSPWGAIWIGDPGAEEGIFFREVADAAQFMHGVLFGIARGQRALDAYADERDKREAEEGIERYHRIEKERGSEEE
jgi:hypothetical protein